MPHVFYVISLENMTPFSFPDSYDHGDLNTHIQKFNASIHREY